MDIKFAPWPTPTFARMEVPTRKRQDGFIVPPYFHVSNLTPDQLSAQCDRWRADVFAKAGLVDPKEDHHA